MDIPASQVGAVESHSASDSECEDTSNIESAHLDVSRLTDLASRVICEKDFANGLGDVKLIIRYHRSGETLYEAFLASSTAMILACRPWQCLLAGWAAEGQPGNPKILDYTENDCAALEIVMNIIHLRFSKLPQAMELDDLFNLAILTDKYFLTATVSPWSQGWVERLSTTIEEDGKEIQWLWISQTFDLTDIVEQISHKLSFTLSLNSGSPTSLGLGGIQAEGLGMQEEDRTEVYQLARSDGSLILEIFPPGIKGKMSVILMCERELTAVKKLSWKEDRQLSAVSWSPCMDILIGFTKRREASVLRSQVW